MPSRRQFIRRTAAAGTIATLAGCAGGDGGDGGDGGGSPTPEPTTTTGGSTGTAQPETIKIGSLHPLAPPLTQMAEQERRGIQTAVKQVNANGGIDGKQVELVSENTEANPQTGLEKAKRLVEDENVDMLYGVILSSTAFAVTEYANAQQVPLFTNASADPLSGERCQKSTFVLNPSEFMRAKMLAPYIVENSGTKGWIHIYDFAWGYSVEGSFKAVFEQMDADVTIQNVTKSALTATDFSNSISQIASADIDWALLGIGGAGLGVFMQQAAEFGLQENLDLYGPEAVQSARQMAGEAMTGFVSHGRYSWDYDTPQNNAFVEAFLADNDLPPNQLAKDAWEGVNVYKTAVEQTGSTAFGDVVGAVEELEIDSLMGSLSLRDCDHRCVRPMHIGRVGEPDKYGIPNFEVIETVDGPSTMPPCEQTGCSF